METETFRQAVEAIKAAAQDAGIPPDEFARQAAETAKAEMRDEAARKVYGREEDANA